MLEITRGKECDPFPTSPRRTMSTFSLSKWESICRSTRTGWWLIYAVLIFLPSSNLGIIVGYKSVPDATSLTPYNFFTWPTLTTNSFKENGAEPFFHRKSGRVVLSVLHVENEGQAQFIRGINSEVSLPTGSICAERSAIGNARALFPNIGRKQMKLDGFGRYHLRLCSNSFWKYQTVWNKT